MKTLTALVMAFFFSVSVHADDSCYDLLMKEDYEKALSQCTEEAEQGFAEAQFNLAIIHYSGYGTPQNYKQSVHWYTKAAEQGYAEAQFTLGLTYGKGEGVPQDPVKAYAWINVAAAQGHKEATGVRDDIVKLMTPTQIEKAQELSSKYFKLYVK